ncbi:MAG: phosphoenolpyruvate carboxykinase (ATP) [Thermoplasmata archaeon]
MEFSKWLQSHGFDNWKKLHYQQSVPELVEHALRQGYCNAKLAANGALAVQDVPSSQGRAIRTGRSPADKFIVKDDVTTKQGQEVFFGEVNHPMSEDVFERLLRLAQVYLQQRELWIHDSFAGAHPDYRVPIRFITDAAWMSLFAKTLFIRPHPSELKDFKPQWTIISAHDMKVDGPADGVKSDAFAAISFKKKICLIGGLHYAGEIKKAVFTVLNYIMPVEKNVFPMHCSVNADMNGENLALFFGLSGTGKTTLSADPNRRLIGDDQHGWAPGCVFNFEAGCYAKCINLSKENEPQIWNAIRFGSILENVPLPADRSVNYDDDSLTKNTRVTYPVEYIPNCILKGYGGEPKNIIFLTCDAFGVLPPVARLNIHSTMYHFLLGFTSKVAGTETGITEPVPTFSTCFGAPFMPLHPSRYAAMLKEAMERSGAQGWLVNTGWIGGMASKGSKRISIPYTRAIVSSILNGSLNQKQFRHDRRWNLDIPVEIEGVPSNILDPSKAWADAAEYEKTAQKLAKMFVENFKQYESFVLPEVIRAGPSVD